MQSTEGALSGTVTAEEPDDVHYVSIRHVARLLGTDLEGVQRLIKGGLLRRDPVVSAGVDVYCMRDVLRCRAQMRGEE